MDPRRRAGMTTVRPASTRPRRERRSYWCADSTRRPGSRPGSARLWAAPRPPGRRRPGWFRLGPGCGRVWPDNRRLGTGREECGGCRGPREACRNRRAPSQNAEQQPRPCRMHVRSLLPMGRLAIQEALANACSPKRFSTPPLGPFRCDQGRWLTGRARRQAAGGAHCSARRILGCAAHAARPGRSRDCLFVRRGVTGVPKPMRTSRSAKAGDAATWSGGVSILFLDPEKDCWSAGCLLHGSVKTP